MTIYAFRTTPHQTTLTEFKNKEDFRSEIDRLWALGGPFNLNRVPAERARKWVKEGGHHETALYTNINGQVRRASDGY